MPNRNGTGPEGKGPGTGRGFGNCKNSAKKNYGKGCGLGRRNLSEKNTYNENESNN